MIDVICVEFTVNTQNIYEKYTIPGTLKDCTWSNKIIFGVSRQKPH